MAFIIAHMGGLDRINRRPRDYKARRTLADVCEREINNYRFPREHIRELITQYEASAFGNTSTRGHAIPAETELLVGLRWLSKGGLMSEAAAFHGISKSSVSRIVDKVTQWICTLAREEISYPENRQELGKIAGDFFEKHRMGNTIGCIDGTHILVKAPKEDEHMYVNRKHLHSLNVQIICDSNLMIRDIEAKWPGSSHDSYVLAMSAIHDKFERGDYGNYWLLGDSGYGCKKWLLPPLLHPVSAPEQRYNRRQKITRSVVERCIGVLKSRFRCLHPTGGILQLKMDRSCRVIVACAVLHNRAIQMGLAEPELDDEGLGEDRIQEDEQLWQAITANLRVDDRAGVAIRARFIETTFT